MCKFIEVYSNGLQLNKLVSKKIIESKLDSLIISIDANDQQSYQKLKGKDEYLKVLKNVKEILEMKKQLKMNRPILSVKLASQSLNEISKFKNQWKGKVDNILIQKIHEWEGSAKISNFKFQISNSARYACNLPWLSPAITWDGKVMPCCVNYQENELVMGNLNNESLKNIWRGKNFKKLREAHLKKDFSKYPTCKGCNFWKQLPNMEWRLKQLS